MRKLIPCILFIVFGSCFLVHGSLAISRIDSLEKKLSGASEDSRIELLNEIAQCYLNKSSDKTIYYAKLSLKQANKTGNFNHKAESFNLIGDAYQTQGNNIEALNFYQKAFIASEKYGEKKDVARTLNNMGVIYCLFGDYTKALDYHLKALSFFRELNDRLGIAQSLNKCGVVYRNLNHNNKALDCYNEAYKISCQLGDKPEQANSLLNIGNIYWYSNMYNLALDNYQNSLKIYTSLNDVNQISALLNNIGNVNRERGNIHEAMKCFSKSVSLARETGDNNQIAITYRNIGKTFFKINLYDSALNYFQISLRISQDNNLRRFVQDNYLSMAEVFETTGNKNKTIEYLKLYNITRDHILEDERSQNVVDLQYQFDLEQKEKEIQNLKFNKNQLILNVIFIFALVLTGLVITLYRLYTNKKKYVSLLEKEVKEKQAAEKLLTESEEKFRTLAELLPEAIYESDENGIFVYVNSAGLKLFGYTTDEFNKGISVLDMIAPEDRIRALQDRQAAIHEKIPHRIEYNAVKKDGAVFPVIIHTSSIIKDNKIAGTRGLVIDITELKKAEEEKIRLLEKSQALNKKLITREQELKRAFELAVKLNEKLVASEANLKVMFDSTLQGYTLISRDYKVISFNRATRELVKKILNKEIAAGDSAFDVLPLHIISDFTDKINSSLAGEIIQFEKQYDFFGNIFWLDLSFHPAYDKNSNIVGVSFSIFDISERKLAEEALKESEEKYRMLVEQAADSIFIGNPKGNFIRVNSRCCELTGYSKDELLALNLRNLFTEEEIKRNPLRYDLLRQGETIFRERMLTRKDGRRIPVEMNTKMMSDGTYQSFIRNVSERKKAEAALDEIQRSLATLMSNLPGLAYRCKNDKDWSFEILSDGCFDLTGYHTDDFLVKKKITFNDLIHVDDRDYVWDNVQKALELKKPYHLTYRITTAGGDLKWVWEQGCGIFDYTDTLLALEGFIIDITERISTEEALVKSEERFRILVENQGEGVGIIDTEECFTFVNPAAEEIFGMKADALLGKSLGEFVSDEQFSVIKQETELRKKGKKSSYEILITRPDKVKKHLLATVTPYLGKNGEFLGSLNIFMDITDRKKAEEKVRKSEERLKYALDAANDGLWDFNSKENRMNYLSPRIYTMLGYESYEFKIDFQTILGLIHPDDVNDFKSAFRNYYKKKTGIFSAEFRMKTKNHNYIWIHSRGKAVEWDAQGKIVRMVGTHVDISERKIYEKTLRENEEKYRLLAEKTTDIIWTMDMNLRYTYMNPAVKRHLGYSVEEYIPLPSEKKYPPESIKITSSIFQNELQKIKNGIIPGKNYSVVFELLHYHKDGSLVWGEVNFTFLFDENDAIYGIHGVTRNITERKRVEEAMRKSEERLKLALDAADDGMWDFNPKTNKVNYFSPRWYTMIGYEPYEFPMDYTKWIHLIYYEDRVAVLSAISNYIKGDTGAFSVEYRMKTKNNIFKWILSRGKYVEMDKSGNITRMVGTQSDISERKEAEEELKKSRQKYMELTEFLPQSVFEADMNGRLLFANRQAFIAFGYTKEDFENGLNISQMIMPENMEKAFDNIRKIVSGKITLSSEYDMVKKDGTTFPAIVNSLPVFVDGLPYGIRGIIIDITERKQAEEQLMLAKNKAEESDHLKSTFLANMSHEIRTPLNAILGFTDLLKSPDLNEEKRSNFIDIISKRGKDLLNIINDIIDISKIESKQLKINPVKCFLNNVLHELFTFFENDILFKEKKNLKLKLKTSLPDNNCFILIDDMRVKQVLTNLIGNAIKFTSKGTIEFGYTIEDRDYLKFYVKDTGIGIPKDKQTIIFDRFRQADDTTSRHYGGTGLGLAISKSLIEMMGGTISVESVAGKGSAFYFVLPYIPADAIVEVEPKKIPSHEKISWGNKTLLIVEDDKVNYLYLSTLLRKTKVQILHAENGVVAVEMCKKNPQIDVVLMDLQMPVLNGYEATRMIKEIRKDLPVIAQTAFAMEEDKQKCINAGCDDFIAKPIKVDVLLSSIEKFFR